MGHDGLERRSGILTDDDIERLSVVLDHRISTFFENIGYDVSTPKSRAEIRDDHGFVRDWRKGAARAKLGALIAVGTGLGAESIRIFWEGIKQAIK